MSDAPNTQDDPPDEQLSVPFFDVSWRFGELIHVRAGWTADGGVVELAHNSTVPLVEAGDTINTAYSWALRRWQELVEEAAVEADPDVDAAKEPVEATQ